MEIVKYLCEFFFTNFWHWLGLALIIPSIQFSRHITKDKNGKKDSEN